MHIMMMLLTMIAIDSESYLCFHIYCTVYKVYEVGLPINFLSCIQVIFLMKATFNIVLQIHLGTVYSKKHAVPEKVRNKTNCAVLFKIIKTTKHYFLLPTELMPFSHFTRHICNNHKVSKNQEKQSKGNAPLTEVSHLAS